MSTNPARTQPLLREDLGDDIDDDIIDDDATAPVSPPTDRPSTIARIFAVLIPAGICLAGIAFAGLMVATRPTAERAPPETRGLPVHTRVVTAGSESVVVSASGQVVAARLVVMQPELTGRVTWMNEHVVPGGRVAEGESLLRIDGRDFRAAIDQQAAQVETSRVQLTTEESRRAIAEREWALMGREGSGASAQGRGLALREPQVRSAEAGVRAAQSGLRRARTNLSRTTLRAPFDAFIQAEAVDVGQLVGPGSQVATLVGTEHFWVRVSIPMDQLRWVRLPSEDSPGSTVTVTQNVGEAEPIVRHGRVIRLLGDLDPVGRMARVLVEIDDPLGLSSAGQNEEEPGLPMLLSAFVHVAIEAGSLDDVVRVERDALHSDDQVYLFRDDALAIQEIEVVWRESEAVFVRGLQDGDELILSQIATPIAGAALRRVEEESDAGTAE